MSRRIDHNKVNQRSKAVGNSAVAAPEKRSKAKRKRDAIAASIARKHRKAMLQRKYKPGALAIEASVYDATTQESVLIKPSEPARNP